MSLSPATVRTLVRSHVDYVSDVPARRKPREGYALSIVLVLLALVAVAFAL